MYSIKTLAYSMRWVTLAVWLMLMTPILLAADATPTLNGPPTHYNSVEGKDFRLTPAHPKDAAGKRVTDLPATRIDVFDGFGEWEQTADAALLIFDQAIPAALRSQVQLFHANATGWLLVPRGWRVRRAAVGVDGTLAFSFIAANGVAKDRKSVV